MAEKGRLQGCGADAGIFACGAVISSVNDILGIFNSLFDWMHWNTLELDYVLSRIIDLVKVIMFAVLGFRAFSRETLQFQLLTRRSVWILREIINNI